MQVGDVHHQEESLLERVAYGVRLVEYEPKIFLDLLGDGQRVKDTATDVNDRGAQAARRIGIRQQVFRQ
ncbi:hypothetical protein D3C83_67510 [compost metagenome]